MSKKSLLIGLVGLFIGLAGCTGTIDPALEILLVTAYGENAAGAEVAIIQDLTATGGTEDFQRIEESRRPLLAPPIDYDIVDRLNRRTELAVLVRILDTNNLATIMFFNLEGLSADDTSAFSENIDRRIVVQLGDDEGLTVDEDVSPAPDSFCPVAVQVGSDGRYIALLNDQSECGSNDPDAIDIIDLDTRTIIAHIQDPLITTAFFLDQVESRGGDQDSLYYFEEVAGEPELRRLDIPEDGDDDEPEPTDLDITVESDSGDEIVDFGPIGDDFLVLREQSFIVIPNQGGALSEPDEDDAVDTSNDSEDIVLDDFRAADEVIILSDTELTVHSSVLDEDENDISLRNAVGVIDPLNEFAYLLSDGRIARFDLFTYDGEDIDSDNYRSFVVDNLPQPVFAIWVQAQLEGSN
ncbi:MAG: hypothetical protein AAF708_01390 [Deinococcota bacterium]